MNKRIAIIGYDKATGADKTAVRVSLGSGAVAIFYPAASKETLASSKRALAKLMAAARNKFKAPEVVKLTDLQGKMIKGQWRTKRKQNGKK